MNYVRANAIPLVDDGLGNSGERVGITDVAVLPGGPDDWAAATGQFLRAGS